MADIEKPIDKLIKDLSSIADKERRFAQQLREQAISLDPVSAQVNDMLMRKAENIANAIEGALVGFGLRTMLNSADTIAEGKPARPDKITDIPLHYLRRANSSDYEHLSNRPDMRKQDRAKYDESEENDGA